MHPLWTGSVRPPGPPGLGPLYLPHEVEQRAVLIDHGAKRERRFTGPIGEVTLRGNDSFLYPLGRAWALAAKAEDPFAAVRVGDAEHGVPVGPLVDIAYGVHKWR